MTQNGARIDQKWSQNRKKCAEPPKVATRWLPRPIFLRSVAHFTNFWVPSRTQKSTKNRSLATKGAPGSDFLLIFLAESVFIICGLKFSSIFGEKLSKKSMHFFTPARVFFKLATLTKHCILRYESYFFVFSVLVFFFF